MPEGPKRDAQIKKNLQALDDKIARQAKLPKGTYIPKGGVFPKSTFPTDAKGKPQILKGVKDKKTGKITPPKNVKVSDKLSVPFEPKETNIQFKSDKLDLDYGKRFAQRDGLTDAERKRKLKKLQRDLNIKNPTITSPKTGGQLPATKANLRKYGFLDGNFKKQNYKKTFTSSGSGSQKSFSMGQSRFKKLTSKIKMPRTQTLRKVGKYALGAYVLNQVLNPGGGGAPIPPPKKEKLTGVKVKDFKFNLAGPGGDGYKPAGMIKK